MHSNPRCLAAFGAVALIAATSLIAEPLRLYTLSGGLNGAPLEWRDYYDAPFSPVRPRSIVADSTGRVIFCNDLDRYLTRVSATGVVSYVLSQSLVLDLVRGIAIGPGDVLAISDANRVGLISADDAYSALAGSYNESGSNDGAGSTARFKSPRGLAFGPGGNVYVADTDNHTIRRVAADGSVITLAGLAGEAGATDATGFNARFNGPRGIAVDASGNVFVADTNNNTLRKITPAGVVTTIAGSPGLADIADGTGAAARFNLPEGIALDTNGDLIVADTVNGRIRRVTQAGVVTTIAGGNVGINAFLNRPTDVAVDPSGRIYITDNEGFRIHRGVRALEGPTGVPSTVTVVETYSTTIATTITDNAGSFTHRWQVSTNDGATWSDLINSAPYSGATTATLRLTTPPRTMGGYRYRVVIKDPTNDERVSETTTLIIAPPLTTEIFAGTLRFGDADGTGQAARFFYPAGLTRDADGNLYLCDLGNNRLRKVTPAGEVSTFVGSTRGSADGTGVAATFNSPSGITRDVAGNFYVTDRDNHTIRKVTPGGTVSTIAGQAGTSGSTDGTGSAARFKSPNGITVGSSGELFVVDSLNATIRKVTTSGAVTTLAGSAGQFAIVDGTGGNARFNSPGGIAANGAGDLFVGDSSGALRKVTSTGVVSTIAGSATELSYVNGVGLSARFFGLRDLATDSAGNLYLADAFNHAVRKMAPDGTVTSLVGGPDLNGHRDGLSNTARLGEPKGITVSPAGIVYFTDQSSQVVRAVSTTGTVTTLAGPGPYYQDGAGGAARFNNANGMAADSAGNIYVADTNNHVIRRMTPAGVVTTLAGTPETPGFADGSGGAAMFNQPTDVAVAPNGDILVADTGNHVIRRVTSTGAVSTVAGIPQVSGSTNGPPGVATFSFPASIAVAPSGEIFVAVNANFRGVRRISSATSEVTNYAGSTSYGTTNGPGDTAAFTQIGGMAVDAAGNLFVADVNASAIRKIAPDRVVSTFVGGLTNSHEDGQGARAGFSFPTDLAFDVFGNLFVADQFNYLIRQVTRGGLVTTVAGSPNQSGSLAGTGSAARFTVVNGITVAPDGTLYIADIFGLITKAVRDVALLSEPTDASLAPGGAVNFDVHAVGTGTVTYRWQFQLSGTSTFIDLPGVTGATYSIASAQRFHAGTYRVVASANGLSATTDAFSLSVTAPTPNNARLLNLSTRAQALTGDDVLIPGFVIAGTGNKRLLIRAVGPTLGKAPFNLGGVLPDPRLRLLKRNTTTQAFEEIAANDNWGTNTNAAAITQTAADLFAFGFNDDREAALLLDVAPGEYTAIASGTNNVTGIAIVELYDADTSGAGARLINISNRGFAGVGDQVMIPGFVVSSEGPKTFLVRVVGPTLGGFGVGGTMVDPRLTVFSGQTAILSNDNWGDNPDAAYTAQIASQVSAFPLTTGSKDAAFVVTLPPGSYTVVGSSAVASGTGVVLVEIYVVP